MTESTRLRNEVVHLRAKLPRELALGALLLTDLKSSGALEQVAQEFRVARKAGGFAGIDAVIFLLVFFASGWRLGGLRGFAEAHRPFATLMGALVGRARMMGQASLSRLLDVVTVRDAREMCRRLLRDHVGALDVLRSPAVQTTDGCGAAWHVFDFDPNREVYRRRDLTRADERPPGVRRTDAIAAPGHRGRKRGEVVLTQGLLVHQGSGLWLDASVQAGNGDPRELLGGALDAAAACCDALGHPRDHALVRADGEFGGVPSFSAAASRGMAFVSRLSRYDMLDAPTVRARLKTSRWERVNDAGAGPVRIAADLGLVMLEAGETTYQADGTRFAPIEVRVVVSCYRCPEHAQDKGRRGHRIGDAIFEMFGVVGLEPRGWSAGDIVSAYYGRCGQENRFAQADRELGIDSTFSFHPGGHLLAIACALATWNWKIVQAVRSNPLPLPPPPSPRVPAVAEAPDVIAAWFDEPQPPEQKPDPPTEAVELPAPVAAFDAAMANASVASALMKRGMRWNATEHVAEDAAGNQWELSCAVMDRRIPSLRFTRLGGPIEHRHRLQVSIPEPALHTIKAAANALRPNRQGVTFRQACGTIRRAATIRQACPAPRKLSQHPTYELTTVPAPPELESHGFAIIWPLFLPAKARFQINNACHECLIVVDAWIPHVEKKPSHPLMATNVQSLHQWRWSWSSRLAHRAAPSGTRTELRCISAESPIIGLSS